MSKSVDKRVVEMGFENRNFEKGIKESSTSLKDFNSALEKTGKSGSAASGLGKIADGIAGKFGLLGTIATGALLKIGSQAVTTGVQLAKSLSLDQIIGGFQEYELKINSIKTILAGGRTAEGLPVTLEMVNKQLAELNTYADQTIYSFKDMTSNIGKFTNAGVDLETAVQSMKGISNVAAVSGANTQEASRAMYNFAQALSAGYVKFIDWKSIENANMATVEFKEQLLEAAVAAGTVEKTADGMYKVLTGGSEMIIGPTKDFNQSLQDQWMTTEVLTTTLTKYADANTEIGAKATEAATKVRTFSQLMDTVKEAIGSGWGVTFENIFGDYNEATELWSTVSQAIDVVVSHTSDARNEMIGAWKQAGLFKAIFEGLKSPASALWEIFLQIKTAFSEVFPRKSIIEMAIISDKIRNFLKGLKPSVEQMVLLRRVFLGFFNALKLGWKFASSIFKGFSDGIKSIIDSLDIKGGKGLLYYLADLGQFFTDLSKTAEDGNAFARISKKISTAIETFFDKIIEIYDKVKNSKVVEVISDVLEHFKEALSDVTTGIDFSQANGFFEKVGAFFENFSFLDSLLGILGPIASLLKPIADFLIDFIVGIKDSLVGTWKTEGLSGFIDIINVILEGGILLGVKELVKTFTGFGETLSELPDGLTGIFSRFEGVLKSYQDNLKSKQLISIAIAIGILAASVLVLSHINADRLESAVSALATLFLELGVSFAALQKVAGSKGLSKMSIQLIGIASSVLILAIALKTISKIEPDRLKQSIAALGGILLELLVFSKLMSGTKGLGKAAIGLIALGVAINIIVLAVRSLGNMDYEVLRQGLLALGAIALGMGVFAAMISQSTKGGNLLIAAAAMTVMSVAILEMVGVVALLGVLDPTKLQQGLIALGAILVGLTAFSTVLSNSVKPAALLVAAVAIQILSVAMLGIAGAVAILGSMNPTELTNGMMALAGSLILISGALMILSNPSILIGAAAIAIVAGSILLLTPAIKGLGEMPIENIGKALLALAGIFIIVGAAAALLTPLIPSILALAGAIAILGVGVLAIGAGLMLFGAGLTALSAGGAAAIGLLIMAIREVIELLPFILTKVGEAVVALANVIIEGAPKIAQAIVAVFASLILLLSDELPKLVELVLTFIVDLAELLVEKVPLFVDAAMKIILGFLEGITNNVGAIVEAIFDLVISILDALAKKIPDLIAAGGELVLSVLEGITTEVPKVVDAAFQMIIDFINGLADAIETNTPLILEAVENLATAFIDGVKAYLNLKEGESIAGNIIQGLIDGVNAGVTLLVQAVEGLGKAVINGVKALLGIKSPSTVMEAIGENLDKGLIKGITNLSGKVVQSVKGIGDKAVDGMNLAMNRVADILNSEVDSNPTITPVLNLDEIQSGANTLNGILANGQSYNLAASQITADSIIAESNQNGSSQESNNGQTITNQFNLNGITVRSEADINKIAEKLYRLQEQAMRARGIKPSYV